MSGQREGFLHGGGLGAKGKLHKVGRFVPKPPRRVEDNAPYRTATTVDAMDRVDAASRSPSGTTYARRTECCIEEPGAAPRPALRAGLCYFAPLALAG
ncbi:MAG TPA: hypothetical protein PLT86_13430 [Candidatus Latescibacteria bacterium]|nr:hypothetical protein [Candidatus Latescibacterota bacterium]HPC46159.1 hypothetical protein [Candidatus Latescibacterota bacterium]